MRPRRRPGRGWPAALALLLLAAGCEGMVGGDPAADAVLPPAADQGLPADDRPGPPADQGQGADLPGVDRAEGDDAGPPPLPPPDGATRPDTRPEDGDPPACVAAGAACQAGGEACCDDQPCVNGTCGGACLAPTQPCQEGSTCCEGYSCGTTSLGQVCCGGEGAACATANGEDCCGALLCIDGRCLSGPPVARFRVPVSDAHVGEVYVSAYYDHGGRDWNCGSNRYGGHQGNDMACKNGLGCIDQGRDVVAAAAGEVIAKQDGAFDRCTSASCSPPNGNFVRLRHSDGSTTWYLHMKQFSITVNVGDRVTCGQKLGQIASSGQSTGAHVHFHFNASEAGSPVDPFGGSCSQPESRWVSQQSHNPGGTGAGPDRLPAPSCQ